MKHEGIKEKVWKKVCDELMRNKAVRKDWNLDEKCNIFKNSI